MTQSPEEAKVKQESPEEANEYKANVWGAGESSGALHDLVCPSGQKCLVMRAGVEGMVTAGILHNVDGLTALVEKHIAKTRGRPTPQDRKTKKKKSDGIDIDVEAILKDQKSLIGILDVVDKAVVKFVVKPAVHEVPKDSSKRKQGTIYTDMIDINDRMFIFNYVCGGSADLTSFRDGLTEAVGGVEALESVSQDSK